MAEIKEFIIERLHGYKNYDIKIKNNKLIIVGENGSGKTSVLRLLFYFLTCNWSQLSKINFQSIELIINDEKIKIEHSIIKKVLLFRNMLKRYPMYARKELAAAYDSNNMEEVQKIFSRFPALKNLINEEYSFYDLNTDRQELNQIEERIKNIVDFSVLYLPTYRRIETDKDFILDGIETMATDNPIETTKRTKKFDSPFNKSHAELIQFGMDDVDKAKDKVLMQLKEFQSQELSSLTSEYLGDVVNEHYKTIDKKRIKECTNDDIDDVLNRIGDNIIDAATKEKLNKTIKDVKSSKNDSLNDGQHVHSQVICHYFIKLLDFQAKLKEKEKNIKKFCEICNKYILDKNFKYESSDFSFEINRRNTEIKEKIRFNYLSSGEKQIVSLFSELYLSEENEVFVIIDEPEISLSVPWQKEFLVDIACGDFCKGLFAATHSPFIYDNKLRPCVHGLGEFSI